jgi:hypothetical protein
MRVRNPAPAYIDVDPSRVTVMQFQHSFTTGGLEAYGEIHLPNGESFIERVAYRDSMGYWQAEGTIRREPPPEPIMRQIIQAMMKMELDRASMR